jgi:hypothetical protein
MILFVRNATHCGFTLFPPIINNIWPNYSSHVTHKIHKISFFHIHRSVSSPLPSSPLYT